MTNPVEESIQSYFRSLASRAIQLDDMIQIVLKAAELELPAPDDFVAHAAIRFAKELVRLRQSGVVLQQQTVKK